MKASKFSGVILFILALNCFIWPGSSLNLDYYGSESRVNKDLSVSHSLTFTMDSSVPDFDYMIKYKIYNLKFSSVYAPVDCEFRVSDTSQVSCKFSDHENYDKTQLVLSFDTKENVRTLDDNYEFSYVFPIEANVERFFNMVYLPETATLATDVPSESISPGYGKTISDGKHIMVYWERENVTSGDDLYFSVAYSFPLPDFTLFQLGTMIVIAVIIIVGLAAFYIKSSSHRPESIKVVMPLLKGDEKTVVEIINERGGSVNQRVIVRESDFSKAKVSRLVAGLKERGIVDVEVMGRTNKVTLKLKG